MVSILGPRAGRKMFVAISRDFENEMGLFYLNSSNFVNSYLKRETLIFEGR